MNDGPFVTVISLIPCNPKLREKINQDLPPDQQWKPSIEHSITTCDNCGRDCWIGPKQKELSESVFTASKKLCAICIALSGFIDGSETYHSVNQDEAQIPRRI